MAGTQRFRKIRSAVFKKSVITKNSFAFFNSNCILKAKNNKLSRIQNAKTLNRYQESGNGQLKCACTLLFLLEYEEYQEFLHHCTY